MKKFLLPLIMLLPALLISAVRAAEPRVTQSELARFVGAAQRSQGVPGMAAGLMSPDGFVRAASGIRARGSAAKVEVTDKFFIGSCTKAMTSTLFARLIQKGLVRWDTTLAEVFTEQAETMLGEYRKVTVAELASHRGGVPTDEQLAASIPDLNQLLANLSGSAAEQRASLLPTLLTVQTEAVRGDYNYSNAGYMLLGAIAERVTGNSYEQLMRREVFSPLGMTGVIVGHPQEKNPHRVTQPRGHGADGIALDPTAVTIPSIYNPAGNYSMSLGDWHKFITAHLTGRDKQGNRYLSRTQLGKLHTPVGGDIDESGTTVSYQYGFGWIIVKLDGMKVLTHDGSDGYSFATVFIVPKLRTALLQMTNQEAAGDRPISSLAAGQVLGKVLREKR